MESEFQFVLVNPFFDVVLSVTQHAVGQADITKIRMVFTGIREGSFVSRSCLPEHSTNEELVSLRTRYLCWRYGCKPWEIKEELLVLFLDRLGPLDGFITQKSVISDAGCHDLPSIMPTGR